MNDQKLVARLDKNTGVNVSHCYQCGKCTAGCVLASEMDYPPSMIMRLLQTNDPEEYRKVLSSNAIWICLNCENCIGRCPKEVDIPRVMDYLRVEARREGCVAPQARPVVAFHRSFLDCVRLTGRLYEVGLIAGFKLRTMRLAQDVKLAPTMFAKGKLNLLPERVTDRRAIAGIFARTNNNPNTRSK